MIVFTYSEGAQAKVKSSNFFYLSNYIYYYSKPIEAELLNDSVKKPKKAAKKSRNKRRF